MVCTWYSVVLGSGLIWETQSNNKIGHKYGTVWISSGKMCTRWCMYGTMWHWSLNIIFFILNCFLKLFCFISMSRFVYIGNFFLWYKADSNIQNTYIFFSMVQHRCSKTAQHIPYCMLTHRCHAATNTHITQCNSSNKVGKAMCGSSPPVLCGDA